MRNLQKQAFRVRIDCSSDLKSFSRSLEEFLQTVNFWQQNAFLTCSWRFLRSNELEQTEFKLEKNIGIYKHAGKVRKIT